MDWMQKDFNEVMNKCKGTTDMLQAVIQKDIEGRVMNLEALIEQLLLHKKDQDDTIALLKRALASGPSTTSTMKIQMKEP